MLAQQIAIMLCVIPDRPWIRFTRGRPLTAPKLVNLLMDVGVPKRQLDIDRLRGFAFTLDDLGPAFARYLQV